MSATAIGAYVRRCAPRAGPRQRVVASLGKLDEREVVGLRGGRGDLPALLYGEAPRCRAATAEFPGVGGPTAVCEPASAA